MIFFTIASLFLGLAVLLQLSIIDLKTFTLPNHLVALFALLGMSFHISTSWNVITPLDALDGALAGGGFLFVIGWLAHSFYKPDSLGWGDIKLAAAGGLWLGLPAILLGISLGALIGLLHGIGIHLLAAKKKKKKKPSFEDTVIPAGPGFALGFVLAGIIELVLPRLSL